MVLTVLVVPVLMGAILLLMERFEARLLGVAPRGDVDGELLRPDSHHAEVRPNLPVNAGRVTGSVISALSGAAEVWPRADVERFPQA